MSKSNKNLNVINPYLNHKICTNIVKHSQSRRGEKIFYSNTGYKVKESDFEKLHILKLSFAGGHEFSDYIQPVTATDLKKFKILVMFGSQSFYTEIYDTNENPMFCDSFYLYIHKPHGKLNSDLSELLVSCIPLELLLFEVNGPKDMRLLSAKKLEWRYVLTAAQSGQMKLDESFYGYGTKHNFLVGKIHIEMSMESKVSYLWVRDSKLKEQLNYESQAYNNTFKHNYKAYDEFLKEYFNEDVINENRHLISYVESVYERHQRPVYEYIQLFNAVELTRYLESPMHCLRFVSLIPTKKPLGENYKDNFILDSKIMLSIGYGSVLEHSILLCSLLISFSMEAYVLVGYKDTACQYGVIVLDNHTDEVIFYDPCIGSKFHIKDSAVQKSIHKVHSLFNHQKIYALNQKIDDIAKVEFDLKNNKIWKMFAWKVEEMNTESEFIKNNNRINIKDPLNLSKFTFNLPKDINYYLPFINEVETSIKDLIIRQRKSFHRNTTFDSEFEVGLSQNLCQYETEKVIGVKSEVHANFFKSFMERVAQEGYSLKVVPFQFQNPLSPEQIIESIQSKKELRDLVGVSSDICKYAIRAKGTFYPNEISALWLVIACIFKR